MQILKQMVKRAENMENTLKNLQNFIPRKLKTKQNSAKNQEGVKVEPASKLSLVSGLWWPIVVIQNIGKKTYTN